MKLLHKYIATTFLKSIAIVLFTLAAIIFFFNLVGELGAVGSGHYGILDAFAYTAMTLPTWLYQLFPILSLLAAMIALGSLASKSELIVMRASGVSRPQIIWAVIRVALVVVIVAMVIGEGITPSLSSYALKVRESQVKGKKVVQTVSGLWIHVNNDFIHINKAVGKEVLEGITRYNFDNHHRLTSASIAKEARLVGDKWHARGVHTTQFFYNAQGEITGDSVVKQAQPVAIWQFKVTPPPQYTGLRDGGQQSLKQILAQIDYKKSVGAGGDQKLELVFWQRIFQPLDSLVMMFLAIPFIFGSLRSASMGLRLAVGTSVGFGFYLLNQYLGEFSLIYNTPPIIAAILPMLLFLGLACILMRKTF